MHRQGEEIEAKLERIMSVLGTQKGFRESIDDEFYHYAEDSKGHRIIK